MWGFLKAYSALLVLPDVSEVAPETPEWGWRGWWSYSWAGGFEQHWPLGLPHPE